MKTATEERKIELDNFKHRETEFITSKKEWENERNNLKSEIEAMNQQMTVIRKGKILRNVSRINRGSIRYYITNQQL